MACPDESLRARMESYSLRNMYLTVLLVYSLYLTNGVWLVWASLVLTSVPSFPPSTLQVAAVLSSHPLGSSLGPLLAAYAINRFGYKSVLVLHAGLGLVCFVFFASPTSVLSVCVGRLVSGIASGAVLAHMPFYVTQIAEPEVLDVMDFTLLPLQSLGYLLVYSLGSFVDYDSLLISLLPVPVLTLASLYWVPESPHYHVSHGNLEAAKVSVNVLRRGISTNAAEVVIQDIQERVSKQQLEESDWSAQLTDEKNVRALRLAVVVQSLLPLAGAPVTLMVTPLLLRNLPAAVAVLGFAMFLACMALPLLTQGWGYQKPLIASLALMALSMLVLGLHTSHQDSGKDMTSFTVVPPACLLLYLVAFQTGCVRSSDNVARDLFRSQFSVLGTSATLTCSFLITFLIAFFYFPLGQLLGDALRAWLFASICALASVFVAFCIPDTSRMSATEVQDFLNRGVQQ